MYGEYSIIRNCQTGTIMDKVRAVVGWDEAACMGYSGRGVGVAVMDSGIYLHTDLADRVCAFFDVVNGRQEPYDDNGHGTHIAGIIGGDGYASEGRYHGIATGCRLIGVKILDARGNGSIPNLIKGAQWVLENKKKYGIRIVNISVGMFPRVGVQLKNKIIQSVEQLWDEGIIVVAAAGNNGPKPGTITYPGISRKVITVGTIQEIQVQKSYSGRGPTPFCIMKPEVIAPGFQVVSCKNDEAGYCKKSGTSMATPVVAGALCCLLEKEPNLMPAQVKMRLRDTSMDLGYPKNIQGWGRLWMPDLLKGNGGRRM